MAELTIEQQRALALAEARKRKAGAMTPGSGATVIEQNGRQFIVESPTEVAAQEAVNAGQVPSGSIVAADPMRADTPPPPVPYTPSQIPGLSPEVNNVVAPVVDRVNALGTTFAESVPWLGSSLNELGHNVDAAFASAVEGKPVTKEQREQITEAEQAKYPEMSVPGAILGNTLPLAPLAATKAGQVAFGLAGPTLARLGWGGGTNAAIAFTDALTDGKSLGEAGDAALWGGGLGAAGGLVAPWLDDSLTALGRKYLPKSAEPADNLSKATRETVMRTFGGDDALGPNGIRQLQFGDGSPAMLVDASPSSIGVLDTAIARGGPGARNAKDAIETRAANANTTVNKALDDAFGAPEGVKTTETGLRTGTAAARDAAYKRAYASPIDYSSPTGMQIEAMLPRVPKGVIDLANKLMQVEGHQSKQILAKIADDGTITYMRQPDVTQLDYITRALNTAAKSTEGTGAMGGVTDMGRAFGNLARDIRDATRTAVPAYDDALRTAAHPIQEREALRFGEGLLNPNLARDEAREVIEGFTRPQMTMVRQGVRSRIDEVLANVNDIVSNPNIDAREAIKAVQALSSRAARDKIRLIMDGPAASNRLFAEIAKAQRALELRANVATNSRTYGRTAADEAVKEATDGGAVGALLRGEPMQAGRRTIQNVTGRTPQGQRAMADSVLAELADTLTLQGQDAIDMLSSLAYRNARPRPQGTLLPGMAQAGNDYLPPVISR